MGYRCPQPKNYPQRRTSAEQEGYAEFTRSMRAEYAPRMFLLAATLSGTMEEVIAVDAEMRNAAAARGFDAQLSFDNFGGLDDGITFEMMLSQFKNLLDKVNEALPTQEDVMSEEEDGDVMNDEVLED